MPRYGLLLILLAGAPLAAQRNANPTLREWERAAPRDVKMDEIQLAKARDYALKAGGSGMVVHRGKLVYSWGDTKAKYDLKSTTKSIGATALGVALQDRKVKLTDRAAALHPEFGVPPQTNRQNGWLPEITLLHLATQTAGFDKPGGYEPLLFKPGAKWSYSDGGPNWLAECLTLIYGRDLDEVMFERVFMPLGITRDDLHWRPNAYRDKLINGIARREFGSGIHANVDAMARIGMLYLRAGRINNRIILPSEFIAMLRAPVKQFQGVPVLKEDLYPNASNSYGLLWWNNADGVLEGVPRDAYWSWGLYDSHIVVIPSLDLVITRAGKAAMGEAPGARYSRLAPLVEPVVAAVDSALRNPRPPYPPSKAIAGIEWAGKSEIVRDARDCDLFPTTWADDDVLYTVCGDGWGFAPRRKQKMGISLAKLLGPPSALKGVNIESNIENTGMGEHGRKTSGLLMVDGVLYMLARNARNSQLAWSTDHAKTWTWADWKFTTSFGHPSFLNFGKNYAGARDGYVYVYSHDNDSAYEPSPRMVLARVPKNRIRDRSAYEFFRSPGVWTANIGERGAVFDNPEHLCYRTHVTYNAGLKRYLMTQIIPGATNSRFQGGFGVYDAPEPWGPWTTVYFTRMWDAAPGESQHFPPKWMSADGKVMHLITSGDDMLSVRRATLRLR
jgi:CubicO group peptidase (beta-lactamase class C family)